MTDLSPEHRKMLEVESAISPDVIAARGYYTTGDPNHVHELGISQRFARHIGKHNQALVIPNWDIHGQIAKYTIRPDIPITEDKKGKGKRADGTYEQAVYKYVSPPNSPNIVDCNPIVNGNLYDVSVPLLYTEGAKKSDSIISHTYTCLNIAGVYGWRGRLKGGGKAVLPEFDEIPHNGRDEFLVFDCDLIFNPQVQNGLKRFVNVLRGRKANPYIVVLPVAPGEQSTDGIDDLFAKKILSVAEFNALLTRSKLFPVVIGDTQKKWKSQDIADWYVENKLVFAINDMDEHLYLNGKRVEDTLMAQVRVALIDEGIRKDLGQDVAMVEGVKRRYHPIKMYLEKLKWDGQDHITRLMGYFDWGDPDYATEVMRCWMVGAVARLYEPSEVRVSIPVLVGPEDIGKSYAIRQICPNPDWYCESEYHPENKDTQTRVLRKWIFELGELGAITSRTESERLKHNLTITMMTVRPPYFRADVDKPVVSAFIATANPGDKFLSYKDENTRFATINLSKIDYRYSSEIDVDQLWAQAYAIYKDWLSDDRFGFRPWLLEADSVDKRRVANIEHQRTNPYVEMVTQNFWLWPGYKYQRGDHHGLQGRPWCLTMVEILESMQVQPDKPGAQNMCAMALRQLGFEGSKVRWGLRYWDGLVPKTGGGEPAAEQHPPRLKGVDPINYESDE